MTTILTISGSPSHPSRTAALLDFSREFLQARDLTVDSINVRDLNAEELIQGRFDGPSIKAAMAQVAQAQGLIIGTPVYKAAYTGVLKSFLDLIPTNGLSGKHVLPIVLGGSLVHSLVIDYALRPVLAALGTTHVMHGVFLVDKQIAYHPSGTGVEFTAPEAEDQVKTALETFVSRLNERHQ